ncbi:MAG: hypothetical protein P8N51_05330 [Pseudomonadales bacterium]|nr:hypothetical protein [Pseudomonadales bacterium]
MVANNESFVCSTCQSSLTRRVEFLRCDACITNYELDHHVSILIELGDMKGLEEMVEFFALAKDRVLTSNDRIREIFRLPNQPNYKVRFRAEDKAFEFYR